MKILYVITKSNWGGAQRYVYNLATSLQKDAFEVSVACGGTGVAGSEIGELCTRLGVAGIPCFYIPAFARDVTFLSDIRATFELYRVYKKMKPDIVHLNSSKAGGVGALAARLAGVKKIVFTSHGLAWDEDRGAVATFLIYLFSRLTFALSHQVIVISKDNLERTKSISKTKFTLIHNGIPELQFESKERARLSLALKVGLVEDGHTFWIGTISELTRNKGLSYLIEAANILKEQGRVFHLFILGAGEERMSLQKQVTTSGLEDSVHLAGFVPDAYRYDKAFDVFTLSSVKEGLPTVLLEAGQAGVSVIASNIPGSLDIVEHEKTGLLFCTKDASDFARNVTRLMDDPELRTSLGDELQHKVAKDFSIEEMVDMTAALYNSSF